MKTNGKDKQVISANLKKIFRKENLKQFFLGNIKTKILAVIIAVIFWFIIISGQMITTNISVPVTFSNLPTDYAAVSSVQTLAVLVRGPKSVIDNLKYSSVVLNIDASTFPIGSSSRRILPTDFKAPVGVEVMEITPDTVEVTVDEIASRYVTVIPTFLGDPPPGFKVASIITKPDRVSISGVKSKILQLSSIATFQINLSDTYLNPTKEIGFMLPEGVSSVTPEYIDVTIRLSPVIEKRDFIDVPVTCVGLTKKLELTGKLYLKHVKVQGRVDLLDRFINETSFQIDCSDSSKAGRYSGVVQAQSMIDEGITILSISPEKMKYEVKNAEVFRD